MRAMISGGNAYLRLDGTRGGLSAEREARRILAETEPAGAYAYHPDHQYFSPCDGWRYMGDVWLSGKPQEGNAHVALAEALERFIG